MALPAVPPPPDAAAAPAPLDPIAPASAASPVAVIWCRQVDNEAESPGYTTVPEEFPGHRETLETIRIIGNLTVNVADTQDYWDPDPSQPLSYYPNLFLYPAYGGRYTCVGRMFLSTEDRPRLGMKTVVLDTAQLLATHEFGATVLRWHVSMGGARPGGRLPPVPDAGLYPIIGEGFLFQRGTTDPVVVIASEQWEPSVQAMLELIRVLPASLLAPAAFLAFPYFLPAAKTDLREFTESVPLAMALMRVGRGEAQGERHAKRIAAWESAATVRDLTDGIPPAPRGKETVPLVLQYVRDRADAKIVPISRRVDLVELPKIWTKLADPDRSSGKERRKEMWRIGTAMESAALLLSRARGRHVPVSVETAKRAQEYLQARVPPGLGESTENAGIDPPTAVVLPEGASVAPHPGHHPPWLQRSDAVAPVRVDRVEVVPISHSDDPSLLPAAARNRDLPRPPAASLPGTNGPPAPLSVVPPAVEPSPPAASVAPAPPAAAASPPAALPTPMPPVPATSGAATPLVPSAPLGPPPGAMPSFRPPSASGDPPFDPVAFRIELERTVAKWVETRLAQVNAPPPAPSPAALGEEIDRRVAEALRTALAARPDPVETEARLTRAVDAQVDGLRKETASQIARLIAESEGRLGGTIDARTAALDLARGESVRASEASWDRKVQELAENQRRSLELQADSVDERLRAVSERLESLKVALDRVPPAVAVPAPLPDAQVTELVGAEVQRQVGPAVAARLTESQKLLEDAGRALGEARAREQRAEVAKVTEAFELRLAAAAEDLRQGLAAQLELARREAQGNDAVLQKSLESRLAETLDGRLREVEQRRATDRIELEARQAASIDVRLKDLEGRLPNVLLTPPSKLSAWLEGRASTLETQMAARQETFSSEVREAQAAAGAELQVRLQAYFDQRLRESAEKERTTSVELLARLKAEVDAGVARFVDSPELKGTITALVEARRDGESEERDQAVDERVRASEARLRTDVLAAVHRLESLEESLESRGKELRDIEVSIRGDLAEVERRTAILSDRLVPVVRKTWLKIGDLERAGTAPDEAEVEHLRREFHKEVRRLEADLAARDRALRDRMETSIANQGRVWLTLIRQLSQLSGDRRAPLDLSLPEVPAAPPPRRAERAEAEESSDLDDLPDLLQRPRRAAAPPRLSEEDDEPDEDRTYRRRRRSAGRTPTD